MMAKNHRWRIKRVYFEQLRSGRKKLEIRVGYEWVKSVKAGDTITFENYGLNCFLVKRVTRYDGLRKMLESEGVREVLPGMGFDAALRTLRKIYPPRKEAMGIYVLELEPGKYGKMEKKEDMAMAEKIVDASTKNGGDGVEPSVFTKIIRGEIPCYKIYEDARTLAFLDINPEVWGHTLVVPKVQVDRIYDLPEEDFRALMDTAKKLGRHYEDVTGLRTIWKVIGTDVPHAHIHVEPLDETWVQGQHLEFSPEEMEEIKGKLELK